MPLCCKCKKTEGVIKLRTESTCWECFDAFFDKTFRSSLGKCIPHSPRGVRAARAHDGCSCPQARPAALAKAIAVVCPAYGSVLLADTLCKLLKLAREGPADVVDRAPPFRNLSLDIAFVDEFPFVPQQQTAENVDALKKYFSHYRVGFDVLTFDNITTKNDVTSYLSSIITLAKTREQNGYIDTFRAILLQRMLIQYAADNKYEYVILPTTGSDAAGNVLGFLSLGLAAHAALAASGSAAFPCSESCPGATVTVCQPLLTFLDDEIQLAVDRRELHKMLQLKEVLGSRTPLGTAKSFVSALANQFVQTPFNILSTGAFISKGFKSFSETSNAPLCECCKVEPACSSAHATSTTRKDGKREHDACCTTSASKRVCVEGAENPSEQAKAKEEEHNAPSLCSFCSNFFNAFSDLKGIPCAFNSGV